MSIDCFSNTQWKSCKSFKLIDLWAHQENYKDNANVHDKRQEELFTKTKENLAPWDSKTEYFRMYSTEAAERIPDQSLDFVYVDARHDYCGVTEDINAYYAKLRPGGIMAGHDYLDAHEIKTLSPRQDWSICMGGTVNTGAVKGAVEDFAMKEGLVVSVMYKDAESASWMIQKPTRMECVYQPEETTIASFGTQVTGQALV